MNGGEQGEATGEKGLKAQASINMKINLNRAKGKGKKKSRFRTVGTENKKVGVRKQRNTVMVGEELNIDIGLVEWGIGVMIKVPLSRSGEERNESVVENHKRHERELLGSAGSRGDGWVYAHPGFDFKNGLNRQFPLSSWPDKSP